MAFRIRKPSQESFFALNAIPLYSYAIPLPARVGAPANVMVAKRARRERSSRLATGSQP